MQSIKGTGHSVISGDCTIIHSNRKKSNYRRLYVAYLIDTGVNTVSGIIGSTGMPKRTLQYTLSALEELDIQIESIGGTKNLVYSISSWGPINKNWIKKNLQHIKYVLELT